MQINRLFEIVYILLQKNGATAKQLAARFEVSPRTIYRDVDALSAAGIPIYTQQGTNGGIFLDDDFVLNKSVLSESEQQNILVGLRSLSAAGNIETERLLGRLGSLFKQPDADWIDVDFSRWGHGSADQEKFDTLAACIREGRAASFAYASSYGNTSRRKAWPRKLVYKSRSWYLQAYSPEKSAYRTFKLSRLFELEPTDEMFDKAELPAPPPLESAEMPPGRALELKLLFKKEVAFRVYDEFDAAAFEQQPDGSFVVTQTLIEDAWVYAYILSFGEDVEVLEPKSVIDKLLDLMKNIEKKYRKT